MNQEPLSEQASKVVNSELEQQRPLRPYAPPRLILAGAVNAVTAVSGAPTAETPRVTRAALTTSSTAATRSGAGVRPVGEERALSQAQAGGTRNTVRPKMPKTGGGGLVSPGAAPHPLATSLTLVALAAGLAAIAGEEDGAVSRGRQSATPTIANYHVPDWGSANRSAPPEDVGGSGSR